MSVFLVMLPSPTEIRQESSLHHQQKLIQEKETLYNNENINPTLIWGLIKSDIRGYAIKYSSCYSQCFDLCNLVILVKLLEC
jgi:hypothetical protein